MWRSLRDELNPKGLELVTVGLDTLGDAGCRAFIAAPRARTAGRSLEGQAFLHDYVWRKDKDFKVLELILTAPVGYLLMGDRLNGAGLLGCALILGAMLLIQLLPMLRVLRPRAA